ncbi:MAG: redoxin domain-containing protein [Methanomicrobiales archaeon]|nr:redoxin domain-containing protein [Methanomicrobiales archaeon]
MKKDTVKKIYLGVAFFLVLCATCFSGCISTEKTAQVDQTLHEWMDTEMTDVVTGDSFTLRELTKDGVPIVVHLYATWCPYCNMQLTESTTFLANYPEKAHLVVIDIDASETPEKIANHVKDKKYGGTFATAEVPIMQGLMELFGQEAITGGVPQTILFSGENILYLGSGVIGSNNLADRLDAMQQQLVK